MNDSFALIVLAVEIGKLADDVRSIRWQMLRQ